MSYLGARLAGRLREGVQPVTVLAPVLYPTDWHPMRRGRPEGKIEHQALITRRHSAGPASPRASTPRAAARALDAAAALRYSPL